MLHPECDSGTEADRKHELFFLSSDRAGLQGQTAASVADADICADLKGVRHARRKTLRRPAAGQSLDESLNFVFFECLQTPQPVSVALDLIPDECKQPSGVFRIEEHAERPRVALEREHESASRRRYPIRARGQPPQPSPSLK